MNAIYLKNNLYKNSVNNSDLLILMNGKVQENKFNYQIYKNRSIGQIQIESMNTK